MNKLETENGTLYEDIREENIASALNALNTTDNTFAILRKDDGSIIQAANNGKKGFYVEMQDFKTKNVIRCDENFMDINDVIHLFVKFERNGAVVAPPQWSKFKIRTLHHPKVFNRLNYIGLAFIAVSLYFLFTDKFNSNHLAKYIVLAGCWLMVPSALVDAVNFINQLKRRVFDFDAMRSLVIILIAVFSTIIVVFK